MPSRCIQPYGKRVETPSHSSPFQQEAHDNHAISSRLSRVRIARLHAFACTRCIRTTGRRSAASIGRMLSRSSNIIRGLHEAGCRRISGLQRIRPDVFSFAYKDVSHLPGDDLQHAKTGSFQYIEHSSWLARDWLLDDLHAFVTNSSNREVQPAVGLFLRPWTTCTQMHHQHEKPRDQRLTTAARTSGYKDATTHR